MSRIIMAFAAGILVGIFATYFMENRFDRWKIDSALQAMRAPQPPGGSPVPPIQGPLGRLVDRNVISFSTFVIPGANTNQNIQRWMNCRDILWGCGPIHADEIDPSKSQDLVFTAWYRTDDFEKVRKFAVSLSPEAARQGSSR